RLELNSDREAPLQLGDQIGRLRHVECAGGDEENVIGLHHPVLRIDGGAFNDREDVALNPFPADIRPATAAATTIAARDLVDLVHENDPGLLDALNGRATDRLHIDQF